MGVRGAAIGESSGFCDGVGEEGETESGSVGTGTNSSSLRDGGTRWGMVSSSGSSSAGSAGNGGTACGYRYGVGCSGNVAMRAGLGPGAGPSVDRAELYPDSLVEAWRLLSVTSPATSPTRSLLPLSAELLILCG